MACRELLAGAFDNVVALLVEWRFSRRPTDNLTGKEKILST
jgi:hypothetical protein